jgi:DNA-binding transcriptional ArsR family regulator
MKAEKKGRFAYSGLDRLIHERARLGILSCLMSSTEPLTFADLKDLCGLTDGNLSRHLHALEQAEIIELKRGICHGRPLTLVVFSKDGRQRFLDYVEVLAAIVKVSAPTGEAQKQNWVVPEGWVPASPH